MATAPKTLVYKNTDASNPQYVTKDEIKEAFKTRGIVLVDAYTGTMLTAVTCEGDGHMNDAFGNTYFPSAAEG